MSLRQIVVFDSVATRASNSSSEFVDVLLRDSSFPLDSCSFKWQRRDWNRVTSNFWPVFCPSDVCQSPTFLMAPLSHLLCGANLLISRALKTPSASPIEHSAMLFLFPSQFRTCICDLCLEVSQPFGGTHSSERARWGCCTNFLQWMWKDAEGLEEGAESEDNTRRNGQCGTFNEDIVEQDECGAM